LTAAEAMVSANPKDTESLYYLGAVYGIRAAYEVSAQRRFWAALRDGLRSVKLHQQVLALDPTFVDAYLTLGTYHYALGYIPSPFRAIAAMAGMRGGRQKGIAELEIVAAKGSYNRDDARAVLIALYGYEGNPQRALSEVEVLAARYPQNEFLRIEMASILVKLQRQKEAMAIFDELLRGSDRRIVDVVHYQYADALARDHAYLDAANHFAAVDKTPDAYPPLAAQALVRAGQMYDLAGRRDQAVRSYQASMSRPGSSELRKTAERLVREPFRLN
jgi:tetratricopeptide (TPR) repeat protein